MNESNSQWINNYFARNFIDLTPASASQVVRVLYVPTSRNEDVTRRCAAVLSEAELQRTNRFKLEEHRTGFIQRRAFRRFCGAMASESIMPLSEFDFVETDKGRPQLHEFPNFCFSFSSCRSGFIGAWSPSHKFGVDIEDVTRKLDTRELSRKFFSPAEAMIVEEQEEESSKRVFFNFWTLKEAALKSIGEGLPFGLDTFEFELKPRPSVVLAPRHLGGSKQFDAHVINRKDNCTALVIQH